MQDKNSIVLFDLDGTLIDSVHAIAMIVNWHLQRMRRSSYVTAQYIKWIGYGLYTLAYKAFHGDTTAVTAEITARGAALRKTTDNQFEPWYAALARDYEQRSLSHTKCYPGIDALVQKIARRHILCVVTNKPHQIAEKTVRHLFPDCFSGVYGASASYAPKPNPQVVYNIMQRYQGKRENTLLIGDSEIDFATAQNAKIGFCGVSWGYRTERALRKGGITPIAHTMDELEKEIATQMR